MNTQELTEKLKTYFEDFKIVKDYENKQGHNFQIFLNGYAKILSSFEWIGCKNWYAVDEDNFVLIY